MFFKQKVINELLKYGLLAAAILLIIFYFILPFYNKAQKKGFIEEVTIVSQKGYEYLIANYLGEDIDEDICINAKELTNANKYEGAVVFEYNNETHLHDEYVYLSNDKYVYNSHKPYVDIDTTDLLSSKYSEPRYKNCSEFK